MMKFEEKANVIYAFSAQHAPVAEITPGEVLVVETADCFSGQIHESGQALDRIDMSKMNPATGPFYVMGAEPGDTLEIEILEIATGSQGVMKVGPNLGVLKSRFQSPEVQVFKISESSVAIAQGLSIPLQPMVGVIGVAPEEGEVGCVSPGRHGGNLDTKEIRPGSKVFLPVFHPGALLALGDVHALMGDGEVCGTGMETSAEVKIKVQVLKAQAISTPRVETTDGLYFLSSADNLETAIQTVCQEGVQYIEEQGFSSAEAYMLASAVGQLQFSQVVNPLFTVKFFVPSLLVLQK